jgi:hypothetical protein
MGVEVYRSADPQNERARPQERIIANVNQMLVGWFEYFQHSHYTAPLEPVKKLREAPRRAPRRHADVHRVPLRPLVASSNSDSVGGCWGSSVTGRLLPFDAATAIVAEMVCAIERRLPWATSHPSRNSAA